MCKVLKVTRSGYYEWKNRPQSRRDGEDLRLLGKIQQVYSESRKNYGSPRIYSALAKKGIKCSRKRIARIMRQNGIVAKTYKRFKRGKTVSAKDVSADNLLKQRFVSDKPNKIWTSDITYFGTNSGWLYLAVTMDIYSRKIVGWSMNAAMTELLPKDALNMAIMQRKPPKGLIHHSDRGGQYTSSLFRQELEKNDIVYSLSRKGNCYDNAVIESFFKTLKAECSDSFKSREEARLRLFDYIEVFYNRQRIHSTLGDLSPQEFEERCTPSLSVH